MITQKISQIQKAIQLANRLYKCCSKIKFLQGRFKEKRFIWTKMEILSLRIVGKIIMDKVLGSIMESTIGQRMHKFRIISPNLNRLLRKINKLRK